MSVIVSKHAKKRLRQRVNKRFQQVAEAAYAYGVDHGQLAGGLKRYMDGVALRGRTARGTFISDLKIYFANIYLFSGQVLITVLHVPPKYTRICSALTRANLDKEHSSHGSL